jgi:hypothetical protein
MNYNDITRIFFDGEYTLMNMRPSQDLVIAIGELKDVLQQSHHPKQMGEYIVDVWENNADYLYEQERENFAYHLIDPMLDVLHAAGF